MNNEQQREEQRLEIHERQVALMLAKYIRERDKRRQEWWDKFNKNDNIG